MANKRTYTAEFKREAVRQVEELGKSVSLVARSLEISPNLLHRWRRDLSTHATQAFPGKGKLRPEEEEIRRLKRELEDLREENAFLKKAAAYFAKERPRGTR